MAADSSAYVLKGIEGMLQTEIKFFSMVRQDGQRLYLCLSQKAIFLLEFDPPFQDEYFYARLKQVRRVMEARARHINSLPGPCLET